jgi:DNA-binding NarL/FixJ family response regulator
MPVMSRRARAAVGARKRVLIVDDHPVVRAGLAHLIGAEPDLEICGEASGTAETLRLLERVRPDIVLVDISLGGANGMELTKHIRQTYPEIPVLILSMHDERLYAERALRAGARGYVMKQEDTDIMLRAVRRVLDGGLFLSDKMSSQLLGKYIRDRGPARAGKGVETLTDRELEIFELIGRGLSTGQIARTLHVSVRTVHAHRSGIKRKMGVSNAAQMARVAVNWVAGNAGV